MKNRIIVILFLGLYFFNVKAEPLEVIDLTVNIVNDYDFPLGNIAKELLISLDDKNHSQWQINNLCLLADDDDIRIDAEIENNLVSIRIEYENLEYASSPNIFNTSFSISNLKEGVYDIEIITKLEDDTEIKYIIPEIELKTNGVFKSELNNHDDSSIPIGYEYVPIVREGVVLKYIDTDYNISYITFSGTESVNERNYYKCYFCDSNGLIKEDELLALVREEDKKVYVYPDQKEWCYSHGYWFDEGYCEDEILIYDFNLKKGDAFKYPSKILLISEIDYIPIGNKLRKRYKFHSSRVGDCIIEGIGIISPYSYLPYPLPEFAPTYPYRYRVLFNAEYDVNGDMVYQNHYPKYDPRYEYVPLVQEGVIWTYKQNNEYFYFTICGEENIDGKVYKKCWIWSGDCSFNSNTANHFCYMREENGLIYRRFLGGEEELIYDLQKGTIGLNNCNNLVFKEYIDIKGSLRKKYEIVNHSYSNNGIFIEGVGAIGDNARMLPLPLEPLPMNGHIELFTRQTTMDGEMLYDAGNNDGDPCYQSGAILKIEEASDSIFIGHDAEGVVVGGEGELMAGVYTLDGLKVLESAGTDNVRLSVAELPIGIYVIKVSTRTAEKSLKIVVK